MRLRRRRRRSRRRTSPCGVEPDAEALPSITPSSASADGQPAAPVIERSKRVRSIPSGCVRTKEAIEAGNLATDALGDDKVGQAEDLEWRCLERVEKEAKQSAEARTSADDVVEPGIDVAVVDDPGGLVGE